MPAKQPNQNAINQVDRHIAALGPQMKAYMEATERVVHAIVNNDPQDAKFIEAMRTEVKCALAVNQTIDDLHTAWITCFPHVPRQGGKSDE